MSANPSWEHSKENAAPLQRGRNIATLQRDSALKPREHSGDMINKFEELVRPSEAPHIIEMNDDPLVHWLAYIRFYQNTFPTDMHDQFLLMERCTRALVKMKQYADDDRFIAVCAKYADKTKDPAQVFKYLYSQKVGVQTALFWIAWAYVAEKDNDFPFAEKIFQKGIKKNAQPQQTLKVRYKQFQRRMSRHWLNLSQRNDHLDEEEEAPSRPRTVLGGISRDRLRRNDRGHNTQRGPIQRMSSRQNGPVTQSNRQTDGSFAIYVEEGVSGENEFLDQSFVEHERVIERNADRKKENTMEAERWNERGGLHTTSSHRTQPRARTRKPPPAFAVFVDEECALEHEREEQEKRVQADRHRRGRDDRMFRERGDEGMVSISLKQGPALVFTEISKSLSIFS